MRKAVSRVDVKRVKGKKAKITLSIAWNAGNATEDAIIWRATGNFLRAVLNEEERDEFLVKLQAAKAESAGGAE